MTNPTDAPDSRDPAWLKWARELQSIGHNGLHYAHDDYDRERYQRVLEIAAEMMAGQTAGQSARQVLDLFSMDYGYLTPKIDVRAFIVQDDRVLLVRELADAGRWSLPGGWAEPNDSPSIAVEREAREESGYNITATRLLALYDRSHPRHGHQPPAPQYVYKAFFLCHVTGGAPAASNETGESRFFSEQDLPADLSIARVTHSQLRQFFRMVKTGVEKADFD